MNRREALKNISLIMGGAVSASTISAVMSGCDFGPKWTPRILTPEQNHLVATIAELIIPTTDTPGAREAGVNKFIDLMLADWCTENEKALFLKGLADVDARATKAHNSTFVTCTPEQQTEILKTLEKEAINAEPIKSENEEDQLRPFFIQMKEFTLVGYYTSEIGATQELKYMASAMQYDGCVPFSEVGRAYS